MTDEALPLWFLGLLSHDVKLVRLVERVSPHWGARPYIFTSLAQRSALGALQKLRGLIVDMGTYPILASEVADRIQSSRPSPSVLLIGRQELSPSEWEAMPSCVRRIFNREGANDFSIIRVVESFLADLAAVASAQRGGDCKWAS